VSGENEACELRVESCVVLRSAQVTSRAPVTGRLAVIPRPFRALDQNARAPNVTAAIDIRSTCARDQRCDVIARKPEADRSLPRLGVFVAAARTGS
jgi:hypothetical protein